eukprot:428417-Amphidinium_carterae.1
MQDNPRKPPYTSQKIRRKLAQTKIHGCTWLEGIARVGMQLKPGNSLGRVWGGVLLRAGSRALRQAAS